jgi:lipopolysaccharide export system permease protein
MELALPLFLVAMVMIGASFTLRHQRGGRTGMMVLFAILLSFAVYFIRNFAQVLGENGQLPALLAAWAPPLAAIGLSLGMLLHHEDG